jgi:hypothetical protein
MPLSFLRVQHAISAWGEFLTVDLMQQIEAFFLRAHQYGFCNDTAFASLLFAADQTWFESICKPERCLYSVLSPVKN